MKDFTKRILSSIILLPIALYFMLMGSFYLIFLIIICFLVSSFEWNKMTKKLNEKLSGFIF
jgi:phosphatidate cytidylyltransferase